MKRLILILLIFALVLTLASCKKANSEVNGGGNNNESTSGGVTEQKPEPKQTVTSGGLTYTLNKKKDGYVLTKAAVGALEYLVPSVVEGLPVVEIADGAFKNIASLKKVSIPNSVTKIGKEIFEGCKNIEELVLPFICEKAGLAGTNFTSSIGYFFAEGTCDGSFNDWYEIQVGHGDNSVKYWIPESLTKITVYSGVLGEYSFKGVNLTEVRLGEKIKWVSTSVFEMREELECVIFDAPITSVGVDAFWNCYNLKSIKLTGDTLWIGRDAFKCCYDLEWIVLSAGTTSIGNYAFDSCHDLSKIYYLGGAEDFEKIEIGSGNTDFEEATLYIYSETPPAVEGNYWHYDDAGNPVEW